MRKYQNSLCSVYCCHVPRGGKLKFLRVVSYHAQIFQYTQYLSTSISTSAIKSARIYFCLSISRLRSVAARLLDGWDVLSSSLPPPAQRLFFKGNRYFCQWFSAKSKRMQCCRFEKAFHEMFQTGFEKYRFYFNLHDHWRKLFLYIYCNIIVPHDHWRKLFLYI